MKRIISGGLGLLLAALSPAATPAAPAEYSNPIMRGDWSDPGFIPGRRRLLHVPLVLRLATGHSDRTQPRPHSLGVHRARLPDPSQAGAGRHPLWHLGRGAGLQSQHEAVPDLRSDPRRGGLRLQFEPARGALSDEKPGQSRHRSRVLRGCRWAALPRAQQGQDLRARPRRPQRPARRGAAQPCQQYRYFEGPAIFRHGGWYYLLYSDGGTLPGEPSTISTLRSRAMAGPWAADPGNPVMFSTNNGARFQSPAHGTLIATPADEWFVYLPPTRPPTTRSAASC